MLLAMKKRRQASAVQTYGNKFPETTDLHHGVEAATRCLVQIVGTALGALLCARFGGERRCILSVGQRGIARACPKHFAQSVMRFFKAFFCFAVALLRIFPVRAQFSEGI